MKNYRYTLKNLDCANCAKKIESKVASDESYSDVNVNFSTCKISFKTDKNNVKKELEKAIKSVEPDVEIIDEEDKNQKAERNGDDVLRLITGVAIFLIGNLWPIPGLPFNFLTIIALVILLSKTAVKAFKQLFRNKVLDENTLITISCVGAYLVGKQMESAMVITLYEIGKILEAKAVAGTRKSITSLMDIKPEYANLMKGNKIIKVKPEEVKIGDIITVKAGEKIPLDGVIIKGNAKIDNSSLTGESKLLKLQKNEKVLSGSIDVQGLIEVKVEKTYENSTVSQILNLVENATDKKAKTETFVSKAAKIYTPVVLALAVLVAIFMPILISDTTYSQSIYRALIFLVISCPCSIAISVPLSYFSGIGRASKEGILIKGSNYLDSLKNINEIIFDKTGTITTGKFEVSKVNILEKDFDKKAILNYMAMGEKFSNHPIGESIIKFAEKNNIKIDTSNVKNFKEVSGKGIEYEYNKDKIKIGKANFVGAKDDDSAIYLKVNDRVVANVIISDEIKNNTKSTIEKLNKLGITTKMFTGDHKEVAQKIAKKIGLNDVKYEMLPTAKYAELEKEIEKGKKVAFVGDGINDSPVLARADIGISMGAIGSSSSIEASDVVIMTDELDKIIDAIDISKKTNNIVKQNLIFAIGVKILILILSVFGIATMWEAVFADVGTTLITILNTIRILKK